ncbi:MAG: HAD hydrolase-like protein [Clostridia bacterium]|nr:HAD hydrolase-like protein [Clostridia bacterium]
MLKFKNYLFDLDGTLTDPGVGIRNSIKYALNKFGIAIPDDSVLNEFIGPPLMESFRKYCGVSVEDSRLLLDYYREYFGVDGYLENKLYPDTVAVLEGIKAQGGSIYLATSKPEFYAFKIVEHFGIDKYFTFMAGNNMEETRCAKKDVIGYLFEQTGIDHSNTIMVGDRDYDVIGAHACSIPIAAVLHGYGDREELKNADYILESFTDLLHI